MTVEQLVSELESSGVTFTLRAVHSDHTATVRIKWPPKLQRSGPEKIIGFEDDLVNFIAAREWLRLWDAPDGSGVQ